MEALFFSKRGKGSRLVLFWLVVILVVAIDQGTKAGVREIVDHGSQVLIPGLLNLVHVENAGAAFSMGQGAGPFFIVIAAAFLLGSLYVVWSTKELPLSLVVSIGLVAGGGVGNMIDRIIDGSVSDFLATTFIDFPVFNVADICVTVGIICSIVGFWLWDSRRSREAAEQSDTLREDDGFGHA